MMHAFRSCYQRWRLGADAEFGLHPTGEGLKHFIDAKIEDKAVPKKLTYSLGVKMGRRFDHLGDVEAFITVAEKAR